MEIDWFYESDTDTIHAYVESTDKVVLIEMMKLELWIAENEYDIYYNDIHEIRGGELYEDTSKVTIEWDELPNKEDLIQKYIDEKLK